jgi:uncharacterized membrane protein YfhO
VDSVEAPLYRANGLFKATWVPAGAHRVEFTFEPASLRLGAALSLLGLAAALALIVLGLRRRRA